MKTYLYTSLASFISLHFSCPFQFSIKLVLRISLCPSLSIMGYQVCSLSEEMLVSHQNWCSIFCSGSFIALITFVSILRKAKHGPESMSVPIWTHLYLSKGTSISITYQLYSWPSFWGICRITICSLSLVDRIVCFSLLCLRGYKRNMSRFSPFLHYCSKPCAHSPHSWAFIHGPR